MLGENFNKTKLKLNKNLKRVGNNIFVKIFSFRGKDG